MLPLFNMINLKVETFFGTLSEKLCHSIEFLKIYHISPRNKIPSQIRLIPPTHFHSNINCNPENLSSTNQPKIFLTTFLLNSITTNYLINRESKVPFVAQNFFIIIIRICTKITKFKEIFVKFLFLLRIRFNFQRFIKCIFDYFSDT